MAKHALFALESALRERQLDRTLITSLPPLERHDQAADLVPTGVTPLDASLRGGLPRGHLSEIVGPRSSGRTTLLLQLLATATRGGGIVALVDTFDRLDVESMLAAGVDADRLLWIRGGAVVERGDLPDRIVARALKAWNLVLQAGGFACVAIDLADVPRAVLARIPFTTWRRVQHVLEGRDACGVLVASQPIARSPGGLTLSLTAHTRWAGSTVRGRHLYGADVTARIVSPRRCAEGTAAIHAVAASTVDHGGRDVCRTAGR